MYHGSKFAILTMIGLFYVLWEFFVLDFVRRFFQISEAYMVCTPQKFGCDWQKIGRKSKCRKDSGSTFPEKRRELL